MFRALAALTLAFGFDIYLFDGKYTHAVEQIVAAVWQQF
jgi:hypothetical protein